ncbi:hypothetical protein PAHAL_7G155200 [Panicum hallii]|uniref:NAC domain-containing protein n=1 Tax=Panicum hallii TaxID=206008 RepID=A0A2S3I6Q7_9POAL|nr:NAC domain-containing protein 104-like isoform X2 [Panicum hallii]PAN38216.1 hypothetical protein PAHAL_7G155200 [Panicum hallii]
MGGASDLPPGFHFFPSDEELVVHFLRHKASLLPCQPDIVPTILLNHYDPWELNDKALQAGNQWYFFSHATQSRVTPNGYWSSICADEMVKSSGCNIGLKKTLVFSIGEPSEGIETNWIMHEYHLLDGRKESNNWVICRVFDSTCGSQANFHEEGMELSCLDEVFLSLDDYDEVSLSNN